MDTLTLLIVAGILGIGVWYLFMRPTNTTFAPLHEFKNNETWDVNRDADGFVSSISVSRNVKEF